MILEVQILVGLLGPMVQGEDSNLPGLPPPHRQQCIMGHQVGMVVAERVLEMMAPIMIQAALILVGLQILMDQNAVSSHHGPLPVLWKAPMVGVVQGLIMEEPQIMYHMVVVVQGLSTEEPQIKCHPRLQKQGFLLPMVDGGTMKTQTQSLMRQEDQATIMVP